MWKVGQYRELLKSLNHGLVFRPEHPGDHINSWDFERLRELGELVGFREIIRSKPGGSISGQMQGNKFDRKHPQMSLYIDFFK